MQRERTCEREKCHDAYVDVCDDSVSQRVAVGTNVSDGIVDKE